MLCIVHGVGCLGGTSVHISNAELTSPACTPGGHTGTDESPALSLSHPIRADARRAVNSPSLALLLYEALREHRHTHAARDFITLGTDDGTQVFSSSHEVCMCTCEGDGSTL